jgi:hypothetical protein
MRFSMIRTGFVASATAIALAACGGHGLVPSQSAAPGFSFIGDKAANPCYTKAVQPTWIFKGSCKMVKLPAKGISIKLAAYKGITVTVAFPKNNSKGNPPFVLVDAVGGKAKDIVAFKNKPLPALPTTVGKSVIYIEAVNGFAGLKFTAGNLVVTASKKTLPGKSCKVSLLRQMGAKLQWFPIPIAPKVSGGTVTETIPGGAVQTLFTSGLPKGPLFFNAACK